jgi:protein-S-isoprenylcysteine O-methyltransferase Ste14
MNRGRVYFAAQAVAGAAWWIAVALSPFVRDATLGGLDPVLVATFDVPLFVVASVVVAVGIRSAAWVATGWTVFVALALAVYATVTAEAGWGVLLMAAAAGGSVVALCLVLFGRVPTAWLASGPFAFRPAMPRSNSAAHLASSLGQIAVFWGFFLVVVPLVVAFLERRWAVGLPLPSSVSIAGAALLALASALGLWAAFSMSVLGDGTPLPAAMANRLVVAGPYRFIRNPMAVSGIAQGVAVGLLMSSWLVVVYALLGSLLWNYAIRPLEEADLEARFGDDYRRYRDSVRCWIPGTPKARAVPAAV